MQRRVRNIADIFVPIIPILDATGLFLGLKGVLFNETVLGAMGLTPDAIPTWLSASVTVLTNVLVMGNETIVTKVKIQH